MHLSTPSGWPAPGSGRSTWGARLFRTEAGVDYAGHRVGVVNDYADTAMTT